MIPASSPARVLLSLVFVGATACGAAESGDGASNDAAGGASAGGGSAGTASGGTSAKAGSSGKGAAGAAGKGSAGVAGGAGKSASTGGSSGGKSSGGSSGSGSGGGKSSGSGGSGGGSSSGGSGGGSSSGGSGSGGSGGSGSSSGGSSSGGSSSGGSSSTDYAPYFYTWGWGSTSYPFKNLAELHQKTAISGITLAFVLSNAGCAVTTDIQGNLGDVDAFRKAGGKVKASFGGADGTYLENACGDAGSLAKAIEGFVKETGIDDLDFDVEQPGAMNAEVNLRRSKALKQVQDATGAKIAFTLAANPADSQGNAGGLPDAGVAVVKAALDAGVKISHVNLMVMDYGGYYSNGKKMGDLAVSALHGCNAQLRALVPGLSEDAAWPLLGATPMIGQNDVASEVFGLADAQILADFVKQKHVGLVAFWAIQRDQPGTNDLGRFSGVDKSDFDFNTIFQTVTK